MQPTKSSKNQGRVVFAVMAVALNMQRLGQFTGLPEENMPAVRECERMIAEILDPMDAEQRNIILDRINRTRVKLSKKTEETDVTSATIAAIRVLVGTMFKSRLGTRLDFIRATLRTNLGVIEQSIPFDEKQAQFYEAALKSAVSSI